jgi:hypothetical protein
MGYPRDFNGYWTFFDHVGTGSNESARADNVGLAVEI